MEQSNNTTLSRTTLSKKCYKCNKKRRLFINEICHICHKQKTVIPSGNKVIDDFIRNTHSNTKKRGKMEFVPYDRFKDIEFIAEGGFSKVYKATWADGPISKWNEADQKYNRSGKQIVVLKELDNSKNINSKELNEVQYLFIIH
jgi:hypothetical protein